MLSDVFDQVPEIPPFTGSATFMQSIYRRDHGTLLVSHFGHVVILKHSEKPTKHYVDAINHGIYE